MRVSVVIPALNEERHLGQLLSDIQRQTQSLDEVIVVDAGSSDETVHIAKQLQAMVLHGEPPVARGKNLGGYIAKGDLIFFPDAMVLRRDRQTPIRVTKSDYTELDLDSSPHQQANVVPVTVTLLSNAVIA